MTDKRRLSLQLDSDLYDLLETVSEKSGVSVSRLVRGALLFRLEDLHAFNEWIDTKPPGSKERFEGIEVLKSPGPASILDDIKRIDPSYRTTGDKVTETLLSSKRPSIEARVAALEEVVSELARVVVSRFEKKED
jgi:hypothetical protein